MGGSFLASDFHFLNSMHENEAVNTHHHTQSCMSLVSAVDAYGLIGVDRAGSCGVK